MSSRTTVTDLRSEHSALNQKMIRRNSLSLRSSASFGNANFYVHVASKTTTMSTGRSILRSPAPSGTWKRRSTSLRTLLRSVKTFGAKTKKRSYSRLLVTCDVSSTGFTSSCPCLSSLSLSPRMPWLVVLSTQCMAWKISVGTARGCWDRKSRRNSSKLTLTRRIVAPAKSTRMLSRWYHFRCSYSFLVLN